MCLGSTRVFVEQERVFSIQKRKKSFFLLWKECLCVCVYVWMCDPLLPKTPKKERDPRQESVGRATNKQTNKKTLCYFWKFCDTDEGIVDKTTQPLLPSFLRCQLKRKEKEEEKKKQIGEWCWRKEEQSEKKKKKQTSAKNEEICCITLLLSVVAALFLKARKAHREREMLFLGRFCSTERAPSERNRKWFHRLSFSWVEEHFVCMCV